MRNPSRAFVAFSLCFFASSCSEPTETPTDLGADSDVVEPVEVAVLEEVQVPVDVPTEDVQPDVVIPPAFRPLALVYSENPIDSPNLEEVELAHLPVDGGAGTVLSGDYANVRNCVADLETGKALTIDPGGFQLDLTYCTPRHTAVPGGDDTYRHLAPPAEPAIDSDAFAEVMMYHHIGRIHDFFKDGFGLTDLDYPFEALVNIQVHVALCDDWAAFGNALFTPTGTFTYPIEFDFGLGGPAIIFGQTATKDFSYEADVIAHEYIHAMIGATRLNAVVVDEQGLDNHAGALNEAYADYFACSLADESTIGNYALNAVEGLTVCGVPLSTSGNLARDLSTSRSCPADLTAEVHADAEIFSSALWAIRAEIGPARADAIILNALVGFTVTTDFTAAAEATLAEAELSDIPAVPTVQEAFASRGLFNCQRVIPVALVGARLPIGFESGGGIDGGGFGDDTPGYVQIGVTVPDGAEAVVVDLFVGGDPEIDALVKPGADAVFFGPEIGGKKTFHDAVGRIPFTKVAKGQFQVRLAGACLQAGPWSVALLNHGDGFQLGKATVTVPAEPGEPTLDCPL